MWGIIIIVIIPSFASLIHVHTLHVDISKPKTTECAVCSNCSWYRYNRITPLKVAHTPTAPDSRDICDISPALEHVGLLCVLRVCFPVQVVLIACFLDFMMFLLCRPKNLNSVMFFPVLILDPLSLFLLLTFENSFCRSCVPWDEWTCVSVAKKIYIYRERERSCFTFASLPFPGDWFELMIYTTLLRHRSTWCAWLSCIRPLTFFC